MLVSASISWVLQAAEQGIDDYVVDRCPDMHSYLDKMCANSIGGVFLTLENLGVEENPQFRGVGLHNRVKGETKNEMIVRLVEAFTPKNVDLPESIIALKGENESLRLKIALQQQRNKRKMEMENVVPKRIVQLSVIDRKSTCSFRPHALTNGIVLACMSLIHINFGQNNRQQNNRTITYHQTSLIT